MKVQLKGTGLIVRIIIIFGVLVGCSFFAAAESSGEESLEATITEAVYGEGSIDTVFFQMDISSLGIPAGPLEITSNGTYQLGSSFSGTITIANTTTDVKIIGGGSQHYANIVVASGRAAALSLTIEDLNIRINTSEHGIDFAGAGNFENELYISGDNSVTGGNGRAGIHVPLGVTLAIDKAQGVASGKLSTKGGYNGAGIGGGYVTNCGTITIRGGQVEAIGRAGGAGIGGGTSYSGGNINITGGIVTARGGVDEPLTLGGAGIGGGRGGSGGNITISGGSVTAEGKGTDQYGAAGIGGGGFRGAGGNITINGGTVIALGSSNGAGIGGGFEGAGGNITINGGTITAAGGNSAAGVGGGSGGTGGSITINGGVVTTVGGYYGVGMEINANGEYQLNGAFTRTVSIGKNATEVKIIGSSPEVTNQNTRIEIKSNRESALTLTIENVNIKSLSDTHGIDFAGGGNFENKLYISGVNTIVRPNPGAGIYVPQGVTLVISKAESASVGKLTATGGFFGAGIGGANEEAGGNITIRGIEVAATGGYNGAGMGGGLLGSGGSILIENATVTAKGGQKYLSYNGGAGIGGGGGSTSVHGGSGGSITIKGSTVTAEGGPEGAGIGGGTVGSGGSIVIEDSTITTKGGFYGAGIGGGYRGSGGIITIKDSLVTASSEERAAGIGGGCVGNGGTITIERGTVTAAGGQFAAGIGGGGGEGTGFISPGGSGGNITIRYSNVTAQGGDCGAGIGGGINLFNGGVSGGNITIEGGRVTATGGSGAAGIGGGFIGNGGTITIINDPWVIATRGDGDDIGNGGGAAGSTILKDASGNALSYVRLEIRLCSVGKSNVSVTVEGNDDITNAHGLTGFFVGYNTSSSIGIRAEDINVEADITIAASQVQSRRETVELSNYLADLSDLLLSSGILEPDFSSDQTSYTVSVGYGTSSITVKPTAEATSSIMVNGTAVANGTNSLPIPLEVGSNEVEIVVTAGDGVTKKTYMIYIVRRPQITLAVSGSFTVENKEYDRNTEAVIDSNNLILLGIFGDDDVALNTVLVFDDAQTGEDKTVCLSEASSLIGAQAGDYALSLTGAPTVKAEITAKELTVINAVAQDKVYDGTIDAEISNAELSGVVDGDDVLLENHTSGTFGQADVGTGISVDTEMTITGDDISNYILTQPTLTANITVKELTVIDAAVQDKVYEGTTDAEINGAELNGVVEGDAVALSNHTIGTFAQADVGTDISVDTEMKITGDDISNYTLVQPTLTANITHKELTVINAAAQDKVYDGTTDATITGAQLEGVVGLDDVQLDALMGTFTVKNVDSDITVLPGLTLKGLDKDNYTLIQPIGLTAKITPKELTVINAAAQDKIYDGTTYAEIRNAELSGVVEGDEVFLENHTSGTFGQANVGIGISVETEMTITGDDISNYTLTQPTLTVAKITPKELTVINAEAQDKVYDGTTDAEIINAELSGVVDGDDVLLENHTSGTFGQADVGTGISVDTEMTITVDDISNYTLSQPTLTAAKITPKELTVINAAAQDKVYDGTTDAEIINAELSGVVKGDEVFLENHTSGTFGQADIGTSISVDTEMKITGDDIINYTLTQPTLTAAKITHKELTVINAAAQDKVYDGTTDAEIINAELSGIVEGDEVFLENHTSGTFGQADVGTGISIDTEMTITGSNAGNYYLVRPEGLGANIIVRLLTITADNLRKTYGEIEPELSYRISEGQLVDSDSMTGGLIREPGENTGSYAIKQGSLTAGTNYDITFTGADFSITQRSLTLTAEDKSKVFGVADPVFTVSYDNFAPGEDVSVLGGTLAFVREDGEALGTYTITPSGLTSDNYDITFVIGTLTITRIPRRNSYIPPVVTPETSEEETDILIISGVSIQTETLTTDDGNTIETFRVELEVQELIVQAKAEGKTNVQINIESNQEATTIINVPANVLQSATGMNVVVVTPNATLEVPVALIEALTAAGQGLSLTVERGDVASASALMRGMAGIDGAVILGTPTTINTAILGNTSVTLPLTGITFSDDAEERESFLESLAVFAIHSDGEKKVIAATITYDADGNPTGIKFVVDKFSTFAIIKTSAGKKQITLSIGELDSTVNGSPYILDAAPFVNLEVSRTLVPVRFVSEMLGARVQWMQETKEVIITDNGREIILTIDSEVVLVDGKDGTIDCPANILDSRTFVPLRFVSETLGASVGWDGETRIITITR